MTEYDHAHRVERERLRPEVEAGRAWCAELVCTKPDRWIEPGTPWDLAHDRRDGSYLGPAHAACNRAENARRVNRARRARREGTQVEGEQAVRWVL